jgi:hypothetical protein
VSATLDAIVSAAREMANAEMERDPVPEIIASYCAKHAGKEITQWDAVTLTESVPGLWVGIRRRDDGTIIRWHANATNEAGRALVALGVTDGQRGMASTTPKLWLSYDDDNAVWPEVNQLKELNYSYFAERDDRNAYRRATLAMLDETGGSPAHQNLAKLATMLDEIELLAAEIPAFLSSMPTEVGVVVRDRLHHACSLLARWSSGSAFSAAHDDVGEVRATAAGSTGSNALPQESP